MIFEMFDSNSDGTMDITEFETITSNLRQQGKNVGLTRPGLKERSEGASRGLFPYFFGEDGKKRMQLKSFDDFLKGLHDEIVRLEFAHYDYKNQVSKLLLPCCIVIAVGGSLIGTDGDVTNFVQ
ncbi:hypothetical protein MMC08_005678 [Hypocenomyce scalaris]|nr:hypothetical protein [Hypocenomyce scalaris]